MNLDFNLRLFALHTASKIFALDRGCMLLAWTEGILFKFPQLGDIEYVFLDYSNLCNSNFDR